MEAPRIPSFFKTKRPKEFSYKPWFYDAAKEAREQRNKNLIEKADRSISETREIEFRSTLHQKWRQSNSGARQRNKSSMRLIIIIALLVWIFYYLLN